MTTIKNLDFTSLFMRILFVLTFALTSCSEESNSDEEVNGSSAQSVEFSVAELSSDSGTGIIYYSGSLATAWSAEITVGGDYASFSSREELLIKSGIVTSENNNTLYFYYDENSSSVTTEAENRKIELEFTFEGSEPIVISIWQLSAASEDSPYNADSSPRFTEIPSKVESDDYLYVTHTSALSDGTAVRNYSLCYDITNHAAAWVAFPYHKIYDGDSGRVELWKYDPKIPEEYQPNLDGSYKSYNGNSYDRGHQIASADRQATTAMNAQTFYYSNMTPQLGTLNQQKWATLETLVRDQVCSDTLFVVTGADFTTTLGSTYDSTSSMLCPLPGAYYKVMLRTRTGYTGKAVSECSASELQAIGFWMEHQKYDAVPDPVTVKSIEEKTGFTFFPGVPDEVKASFTSSDWAL